MNSGGDKVAKLWHATFSFFPEGKSISNKSM
jgi:hypothetical protein